MLDKITTRAINGSGRGCEEDGIFEYVVVTRCAGALGMDTVVTDASICDVVVHCRLAQLRVLSW
jgi:hypothetical protein